MQPSSLLKQAMLLAIDPVLGRSVYAPLSRSLQKYAAIDRLFAACHASYLLGGLREELALSKNSAPVNQGRAD
jgi:hypothetical protein